MEIEAEKTRICVWAQVKDYGEYRTKYMKGQLM
jgi:hypothetical protein